MSNNFFKDKTKSFTSYFKNMFKSLGKKPKIHIIHEDGTLELQKSKPWWEIPVLIILIPILIVVRIIKIAFVITGVVLAIALLIVFTPFILIGWAIRKTSKPKVVNTFNDYSSNTFNNFSSSNTPKDDSVIEGSFKEEDEK